LDIHEKERSTTKQIPAGRNFPSRPRATGLTVMPSALPVLASHWPRVAEVPQSGSLEALSGEIAQHRDDTLGVVCIRWGDVDRQRDTLLLDAEMAPSPYSPQSSIRVRIARRAPSAYRF
jgi:hypothetical protein